MINSIFECSDPNNVVRFPQSIAVQAIRGPCMYCVNRIHIEVSAHCTHTSTKIAAKCSKKRLRGRTKQPLDEIQSIRLFLMRTRIGASEDDVFLKHCG